MFTHKTLIYLTFSLAQGCAGGDSHPVERAAADSATPEAAGAETLGTTPPAAPVVQPISVRKEGRYLIRTFELRPGEAFPMDTGVMKVGAIRDREIVLHRDPGTEWKISIEPGDYRLGSMVYMKVISVDHDVPTLRLELRTKTKKYPWEAWAF
jgi:hypothetical protein